ncbi:phosphatidylinositol glycan [Tieghemostelium lacteum]|uniref:N-acetylglucosaminylphosphatidylinositol deacetylase n=1 Tax=Tieghemostelium lacteum TaxID=361077 RepID=A0A152A2W0_TIELA|nr:phosphatidylinositol glycan [Tieghemostelium lacteum]|eukprot:KYR00566.1 phosphatidylinositol glycan [Tieghemostelium lacteum]
MAGGKRRNQTVNPNGKSVLFIIAHPDDECMFFTPTIRHYVQSFYNIHILCLTTGNDLTISRGKELIESCVELGIPAKNVKVDNWMRDGMDEIWDTNKIIKVIESELLHFSPDVIITFDNSGVSSHPNHIDVSRAVETFIKSYRQKRNKDLPKLKRKQVELEKQHVIMKDIKVYQLETVNIVRKYMGIFDLFFSSWFGKYTDPTKKTEDATSSSALTPTPQPRDKIIFKSYQILLPSSYYPMKKHKSQFVWFRYLFIFFSRYSYVNTLQEI